MNPLKQSIFFVGNNPSTSSTTFTPASISGLSLWLDASSGITAEDGGAIASWTDRSGKGNNAVQATAGNRPLYRATGGPNNKPCVEFASANSQYLTADGVASAFSGTGRTYTLCTVHIFTDLVTGDDQALYTLTSSTTSASERWTTYPEYPTYEAIWETDDDGTPQELSRSAEMTADTFYINMLRYNGASGQNIDFYFNGVVEKVGEGTGTAHTLDKFSIGAKATDPVTYAADLKLAEMIVYDSVLSDENVALLGDYLGTKYNITWSAE
jgi:hypothetical protein